MSICFYGNNKQVYTLTGEVLEVYCSMWSSVAQHQESGSIHSKNTSLFTLQYPTSKIDEGNVGNLAKDDETFLQDNTNCTEGHYLTYLTSGGIKICQLVTSVFLDLG